MSGDDPLFLIGAPRSGTSLLYKALCLHPQAAWISNWVRRAPGLPQLAVLNRLPRAMPALQQQVWFGGNSNAYVYSAPRSVLRRAVPMPVEGEPVFTRAGVLEDAYDHATPAQARRLRNTFAALCRWGGGEVVVSKRIANNRRIGLLAGAFPQARFVSLVRDGRAVATSLSRVDWWEDSQVWWYGGTPRSWAAEGGDPWELCARTWVEEVTAIETALDRLPAEQVLRLSYEEFVAGPTTVLQRIAGFAGLDPDERWDRALRPLRFPNMNQTWQRDLGADEVERIERHQRSQLQHYGYEAATP